MRRSTIVSETIFRRSIRLKQTAAWWTIQTRSDELNWARCRIFHELNSLMKSSTFTFYGETCTLSIGCIYMLQRHRSERHCTTNSEKCFLKLTCRWNYQFQNFPCLNYQFQNFPCLNCRVQCVLRLWKLQTLGVGFHVVSYEWARLSHVRRDSVFDRCRAFSHVQSGL